MITVRDDGENHGGNHWHAQEELQQPYQQEQQPIERWKTDQAEASELVA